MNDKRLNRIGHEMKRVLAKIISVDLKDPRISPMTSINDVKVTRDLSFVTFYITILGSEEEKTNTMDGLNNAKGFIKKKIGEEIDLRQMPDILFKPDETIANAMHIEEIIKKIKREQRDDHETDTP